MSRKSRRILWLLNHRTLMPFEIPMLESLGFEVYTPKKIPDNIVAFRSGAVDYSYDSRLTIPAQALQVLNQFDFYAGPWPAELTAVINEYFGTVFTMSLRFPFYEVITKFEGQIVLRAFGLPNDLSYDLILKLENGGQTIEERLQAIKGRFWFGQGYKVLNECEPALYKERSLFLPIGLQEDYWKYNDTWKGTDKHILFVCPDINANDYYTTIYRRFKEDFGDFPYVIVGQQTVPLDDPYVIGYVSDEQLADLYARSGVLYYHSKELRHIHYSPVEAAVVGTPVVFYQESLLGRFTGQHMSGAVKGVKEARSLIKQLLDGDKRTIKKLRAEQQNIAYLFSRTYCEPIWREQLLSGSFAQALHGGNVAFIELPWFDSIRLPEGRTTPGLAPYDAFKARADLMLSGLTDGAGVLDIGDGDGFYSFEAEARGAGRVTCVLFGDIRCFLRAKRELASQVERDDSAMLEEGGSGEGTTYDWVLLRGVLNRTRDPFGLLERVARVAGSRLVIEGIVELQDIPRPVLVYYGSEQRPGYPSDGFGFNPLFLQQALQKLGFLHVRFIPTPDAPLHRMIVIADK